MIYYAFLKINSIYKNKIKLYRKVSQTWHEIFLYSRSTHKKPNKTCFVQFGAKMSKLQISKAFQRNKEIFFLNPFLWNRLKNARATQGYAHVRTHWDRQVAPWPHLLVAPGGDGGPSVEDSPAMSLRRRGEHQRAQLDEANWLG
jgi:hypothetical protein